MAEELKVGKKARLVIDKIVLGVIEITETDFPWYRGIFLPNPDYEKFKHLFEIYDKNKKAGSDSTKEFSEIRKLRLAIVPESGDQKRRYNYSIEINSDMISFR